MTYRTKCHRAERRRTAKYVASNSVYMESIYDPSSLAYDLHFTRGPEAVAKNLVKDYASLSRRDTLWHRMRTFDTSIPYPHDSMLDAERARKAEDEARSEAYLPKAEEQLANSKQHRELKARVAAAILAEDPIGIGKYTGYEFETVDIVRRVLKRPVTAGDVKEVFVHWFGTYCGKWVDGDAAERMAVAINVAAEGGK